MMEFDTSLWQLQRVIKSLKLRENFTKDVAGCSSALSPLFEQFKEKEATMAYYLVLSSNHGLMETLLDDPVVSFLLHNVTELEYQWVVSLLSKMNRLHLLLDIIRYGPIGVTLPLLNTLLVLSEEAGTGVTIDSCQISDVVVVKMLQLFSKNSSDLAAVLEPILMKAVIQLKNLVTNIIAPEGGDGDGGVLKCGQALHGYLSVLETAINAGFDNDSTDSSIADFYKIGGEYYSNASGATQQLASVEKVIEFLMSNLADMLYVISCDVWMSWEEYSCDNNSTLQKSIGNSIYIINEKCRRFNVSVRSDLQQCFNQLQIKPVTEDDELCNATLEIIVENVTKGESSMLTKWYAALVEQDSAWCKPDIVQLILSNISLTDSPHGILRKGLDSVLSMPDSCLKSYFLNSLKALEASVQMEILVEILSRRTMGVFATRECDGDIILAFNKFSNDSEAHDLLREIIILLIQNPLGVLSHILALAISSSANHSACLEILSFVSPVLKLDEFIDSETGNEIVEMDLFSYVMKRVVLGTHSDKEWGNFVAFLATMATESNVEIPASFISNCLVKVLEDKLNAEDWDSCKYLIMALKAVIFEEFAAVPIPIFMAFLAQVALRTSWDAETFTGPKAEVNKICCEVMHEVDYSNWKEDRGWLRDITYNFPETVRSHFCDFWLTEELDFPGSGELYVSLLVCIRTSCEKHKEIGDNRLLLDSNGHFESSLLLALFKILPVIQASEWHPLYNLCCRLLGNSDESSTIVSAFKAFSDSLSILSLCSDSKITPCFEYCMNNFADLFSSINSKEQLSSSQKLALFDYLLKPLKRIDPTTVKDKCYFLLLPVLLKFVKCQGENEQTFLPFLNCIDENWREKFAKSLGNQ